MSSASVTAYTGTTFDKAGQSTYSHECGELLTGRVWYELSERDFTDDGHCTNCGTRCAGVFGGRLGRWARQESGHLDRGRLGSYSAFSAWG